jgi:D-glycero-D-manno-heptose 1,7-bisphosphate phosphatase
MGIQKRKAIFLDKDGTLVPDIPYNVNTDLVEIDRKTIEGLKLLQKERFLLIVVSNQSGIAKGYFTETELENVWNRISALLQDHGLAIDAYYYCPHHPDSNLKRYAVACNCRKPRPGLILKAAEDFTIGLSQSWMAGDILHDMEAGKKAGCRTVLIDNGNETEWMMNEWRRPDFIAKDLYEAARIIIDNSTVTSRLE